MDENISEVMKKYYDRSYKKFSILISEIFIASNVTEFLCACSMGHEMFTSFDAGDKTQGPVHAKLGLYHGYVCLTLKHSFARPYFNVSEERNVFG